MLNVKIPRSMELSNITNCHQLNVVVGQLANSSTDSIVDQVVGLESEASTARTNAADNGTSTANNSESPGPTTSSTPPSTEVVTESATTVPSSPPSTSSSELSSTTSLSPVTTTSAAPETTATSAPSTETVSTSTVASVVGDNNSQSTTVSAPEELSTPEQKPVVGATN
ncbi:PREDICTED: A-agglutinin anchorage subunit-like [Rhagoletis zephyria]|uniref:A-agglutinin anchorage subunit-like n=1 Tax=Rhagoletis zephyria TaxID=28612 RepID=UPI0008112E83|nr:PREDICTED: A-agglutinin anchorage subunit-like [Rhagoletis zephyria]